MGHEKILSVSLILGVILLSASLVNVVLITHSWILGDWMIMRWSYTVDPNFIPPATVRAPFVPTEILHCYLFLGSCPETIVDFIMAPTEAAIASSTIGIMAGIVALLAYFKLKNTKMDMHVNMPRRRFWVGFVSFMGIAVICAALACFILHFTSVGTNEHQCTREHPNNVNYLEWCTREAAACNLLPAWRKDHIEVLAMGPEREGDLKLNKNRIDMACTETRAIKYLQIIIAIIAVALIALINIQAIARKRTRYDRLTKGDVGGPYHG